MLLARTLCFASLGTPTGRLFSLSWSNTSPPPLVLALFAYFAFQWRYVQPFNYFVGRYQLIIPQTDPGSCGKCFLRGRVCTFVVRGEACPPCLAGCLECSFSDRFLFLEALALFRDTGYARRSASLYSP